VKNEWCKKRKDAFFPLYKENDEAVFC